MKTIILVTALTLAASAQSALAQQGQTASAPTPTVADGAAPAGLDAPDVARDDPKDVDAAAAAVAQDEDDDEDVNLAQPDFTIVALPTTLRMPKGKFAFRVTHRFGRPLGDGDFGDLAADLFGLDAGGLIGLELRYGLWRGTQVGVLRTSDRTIQFFVQQQIMGQGRSPVGLALNLTSEGTNNFRDSYSPGLGLVVSREIGRVGAVYVEPTWIHNTNTLPRELADDNDTFLIGVGARVRVSRRAYLVAEAAPRVGGFDPGATHASVGIEMRAGGHAFQLNASRGLASTMAQVARGGSKDDWFIGFNISRKFW